MTHRSNFICFACAACLVASSAVGAETIPVDGLAATVNRRIITIGEVMSALQPMERQLRMTYSGRELAAQLEETYQRVLDAMIEEALILEEFEKREGAIPSQVVDEQIQAIVVDRFEGDRGAFLRQLATEGISMEEWRQDVRDRLAVMALRREEVLPHVVISPRQIRDAYEKRLEDFREPARIHVRMIVLRRPEDASDGEDPAKARAQELHDRLSRNEDFETLAQTYSEDARAARGGDWGWIDPGILRAELAEAVDRLEPNAFSEPVETPEAWYLIKLEGRREPKIIPFSEVRDKLADELQRAEEERIYRAWIDRLRARHHVRIFDMPRAELSFE